ncbi:unnamed protein product [Acanthoscelides obtectus]|uniref:Uncharacterized protein n=1 Tax=Acanthoscelides obtectus TaxID=200917 RepID=A0A9P0L9I0_ACAOB|nr:unnamed protein product [Acanthoscelides obtectus]CAK1677753.1 hypothetical protein AOBTE_LOCUS31536 [Acanthoscelides obtectus]
MDWIYPSIIRFFKLFEIRLNLMHFCPKLCMTELWMDVDTHPNDSRMCLRTIQTGRSCFTGAGHKDNKSNAGRT